MQDGRSDGRRPGDAPRTNGARHAASPVRPVRFDELSDEPIDLVAVQADDELINALASGMSVSTPGHGGYDADDQVTALLAAWKAEVDAEPVPQLVDLDVAVSRVRAAGRPQSRRLRLVVPIAAAAVVAFSVAGVGTAAATARPGDGVAWEIARVVDSERAESVLAAERVEERIAAAKEALSRGEPEVAAQALAAAEGDLVAVRAEEGAAVLAEVQSFLEAKAAETPPGRPIQPGAPLESDPTRPVPPGAITEGPVTTAPQVSPLAPTTRPVLPTTSPDPVVPPPVEQAPAPGPGPGPGPGPAPAPVPVPLPDTSAPGSGPGTGTPESPTPSATTEGGQGGGATPSGGGFGSSRPDDAGGPPSASGTGTAVTDTASTPTN